MPIIFKNEQKSYGARQRLQNNNIKYGTGCHLGGALYIPSRYGNALYLPTKPYYDGTANNIIKDIANYTELEDILKAKLPPKSGNGFVFISKNK